uniref:Phosphoprotein n=4 Tax=Morbillivirus caprinae TaxID=3052343 RepID=A0A088DBX0_9MONO|nr:phosphoprotein [Peste des petits ruminants virus]QXT58651.1 phosphoprotein [Peste des petits ruminants virus]
MAEEQAYHVNKGLECIKSLKASPPDLSTIRDTLESWREGLDTSDRAAPNPDISKGDHQNINQSCPPAIGSGEIDVSTESNLGYREINHDDSEAGLRGVQSRGPNPQIQRYHVYSHGGEEIEGLEDADSLMVQADPPLANTFSRGEDGSDDSDVDSGPDDPDRDPLYDRGSVADNDVVKSTDVEKLEGDNIQEVLNSQKSKRGKFQGGKTLRVPETPDVKHPRPSAQSIKKGTDGNSVLSGTVTECSSINGATQAVPESRWESSERNAFVESAPKSARSAKTIQELPQESGTIASPTQPKENDSEYEYEDDLFIEMQDIRASIAKIHDDNKTILSKLDSILLLKGEIDTIKKQISKQNISISTIEGHLSSIMIAIPGFGKEVKDPTSEVELNPDLRPIISRDSGRALAEVLKKPAVDRSPKTGFKVNSGSKGQLLKDLQLKPVDKQASSAIGFVPSDHESSRSVIRSIIKSSKLNIDHKDYLLDLLNDVKGSKDLKEFHKMLTAILAKQP